MSNNSLGWALMGFLFGVGLGSGLVSLILIFRNLMLQLPDYPAFFITWGQIPSLGILGRISMTINMVHSPFRNWIGKTTIL